MSEKKSKQSDLMSLQLMEIESFRAALARQNQVQVSFQEAAMIWFAEGYAEEFKIRYAQKLNQNRVALA
jgi:hypothetical protein